MPTTLDGLVLSRGGGGGDVSQESVKQFFVATKALAAKQRSSVLMAAAAAAALVAGSSAVLLFRGQRRQRAAAAKAVAAATSTDGVSTVVPAFHKLLDRSASRPVRSRPSGERLLAPPKRQVVQVVLTGGPMGGKASLAARLSTALGELGWRVLVAPSVATLLLNSGCVMPEEGDARALLQFEGAVLGLQYALETTYMRAAAASGERCVIVYDRGVLDVAAFLPREQWPALADEAPHEVAGGKRPWDWYAAVVHLVTAADGAEGAFAAAQAQQASSSSAAAQKRSGGGGGGGKREALAAARAEALRIDRVVGEVQGGHPNYVRIDNSSDFEGKLSRAVAAVVERVRATARE